MLVDPLMGGTGMRSNFVTFVTDKTEQEADIMRYAMAVDTRKCVGCSDCVVACQTENNVPIGFCRDWVVEVTDGTYPQLEMEIRF